MPPVEDCMDKGSLLTSWVQQGQTNLSWAKVYPSWRPHKHHNSSQRTPRSPTAPSLMDNNTKMAGKRQLPTDNNKLRYSVSEYKKDSCDMKTLEDALSFPETKATAAARRAIHHPFRSNITNIDYFLNRSLSELISHCLGCTDLTAEQDEAADSDPADLPALHEECAQPLPCPDQIRTLIQDGCDVNQILAGSGRSPLHTLLLTPHPPIAENPSALGADLVACAAVLVDAGAHLDLIDAAGNTPLNCLESLLHQGLYNETATIADIFLSISKSCDVNRMSRSGRTLLSHSVTYLDLAAEVTRILVNHGGRVWPGAAPASPASVESLIQDREQSAFTWFLRSLIQTNNLAGAESTLNSLSHEMGQDPGRMKSHVKRVMLAEGKHPKVLGPLYLKLKLAMCPFWDEPQHLRYLAWNSIRRSIGPKRLAASSKQLGLPLSLRKYLTLSSSRPVPRK